ncbi:DUF6082 family protein [Streptomyces halobius]|uniref:DUF6082 family protein n=1 Tax=Streptomyces halobius TaxID=2879846 RepID=A0ABY4MD37_9ACTN|nr:DUF6082 family protein [Streptomyces halobius]UQA95690.1 DUF6082 family protein [Streptomyces halobius]
MPPEARGRYRFKRRATWELQWRIGALSEQQLRAHAAALLAAEERRRYWEQARPVRAAAVGEDAKLRTFHQVFESAHQAPRTASAR